MSDGPDPAAARWAILQAVRAAGVAMVLLGLVIVARRAFVAVPDELGYALVVAGLVDTFVAPRLLARRWRSPPS